MSDFKEKRQELILDYLIKNKGECTRSEILEMLKEEGYEVDGSTISRDIKELNYERVDGRYIVAFSTAGKRNKEILKNLFANNPPSLLGPFIIPLSSSWQAMRKQVIGSGTTNPADPAAEEVNNEDTNTDDATTKLVKGMRLMVVQVDNGFESTISELIGSTYKSIIAGCVPGNGCILVLSKSAIGYNTIRNEIRALMSRKSSRK